MIYDRNRSPYIQELLNWAERVMDICQLLNWAERIMDMPQRLADENDIGLKRKEDWGGMGLG